MKTTSHITTIVLAFILAFGNSAAWAAKAPLSKEQLTAQADCVVTAKVVDVTTKTQKSEVETSVGVHRDRVITMTILVSAVAKGAGVKKGEQITVTAWQPTTRIPPLPGLQGHQGIPEKGDTATFYLKKKNASTYEPLLPNGVIIVPKE